MRPTTATEIELMRAEGMRKLARDIERMKAPYRAWATELGRRLSSLIRESQASSPSDNPAENG